MKSNDERNHLERDLARAEGEIRRLVSFVRTLDPTTSPGAFETLRTSLEEVSAEQRNTKAKLAALSTPDAEPRVPTEEEIVAYVTDIEARLRFDPTTAREQLRRMLLNGKLTMTPLPDGSWQASSMLLVGRIGGAKTPKPRDREVSEAFRGSLRLVRS